MQSLFAMRSEHSTAKHSTAKHSTAKHSTAKHSTAHEPHLNAGGHHPSHSVGQARQPLPHPHRVGDDHDACVLKPGQVCLLRIVVGLWYMIMLVVVALSLSFAPEEASSLHPPNTPQY